MMRSTLGLLAALCLLCSPLAHAQYRITTVVGTGNEGYTGDNGKATAAKIHWPQGLALDKQGRLYIADMLNNCVRRVDISGNISTIAGTGFLAGTGTGQYGGDGGPATAADLYHPTGVAIDTAGNIFIADSKNHIIRKIDTAGIIRTVAGTPQAGSFGGDLAAATSAKLNTPTRVSTDTFGNFYIADNENNRIRKVSSAGIITTFAGTGVSAYSGDGGPAVAATLMVPTDVIADLPGNVFIADQGNFCVRKVAIDGTITTFAGTGIPATTGDSSLATDARLQSPAALGIDDSNNVYIVDVECECVRMVKKKDGFIYTIAGINDSAGYYGDGGPATAAWLNFPQGIAVNHKGSFYISDMHNNRVRFAGSKTEAVNKVNAVSASVEVFPNPATGHTFTVKMTSELSEQAVVTIGDITGRKVYQTVMRTNTSIPITLNAPPGIYTLFANTPHGAWSTKVSLE